MGCANPSRLRLGSSAGALILLARRSSSSTLRLLMSLTDGAPDVRRLSFDIMSRPVIVRELKAVRLCSVSSAGDRTGDRLNTVVVTCSLEPRGQAGRSVLSTGVWSSPVSDKDSAFSGSAFCWSSVSSESTTGGCDVNAEALVREEVRKNVGRGMGGR